MKGFMDSQKTTTFIPKFFQEIDDFKSYVKNFHHNGTKKLSRLGGIYLFKFYLEEDG
jgi:hypothetical protein